MKTVLRGGGRWSAVAGGVVVACALWASAAGAAMITVNTTEDAVANDGHCSLREAITAANSDQASGVTAGECAKGEGPDTIVLPAGIYKLTRFGAREDANSTGDLDLTSAVTIQGAGSANTKINGDANEAGSASDRVIDIHGVRVTIEGVMIYEARASSTNAGDQDGGGILIHEGSSVTLQESRVIGDVAGNGPPNQRGGNGGGIANAGTLTISASEIAEDVSGTSNSGPGFPTGIGGGVWNTGTLTIEDSLLFENFTAIRSDEDITGGDGGAIASSGLSLTIDASTLSTNGTSKGGANGSGEKRGGNGGAILSTAGALSLTDSTVTANRTGAGGGVFDGEDGGDGGGVAIEGGSATFVNDTFNGNATGPGGNGDLAPPELQGGDGGPGAAITATGGSKLSLASSTIADNLTGVGGTGAKPGQRGSGALSVGGGASVSVRGTIFANNEGGNCAGAPADGGHNIAFGGGCPAGFSGGDPMLAPLQDNGGPTSTMALGAGSAALDQLPVGGGCPASDQRGVARPQGPACDIGAYELAPTPISVPLPITTPGTPPTPPPTPARRVAPALGSLTLSPAAFRAAKSGASIAKRQPPGTGLSYNDSDVSTTTFTVLRSRPGVRKKGHCVTPPKHGGGGRPCKRFVKVGSFTHTDKAGRNSFRFTGRVGGSALRPGAYELEATPRLAGLTGATRSARFTVLG
ncbi:MAG TPA: CSLREA domain-containing protein [Solirubrobacteraceae bacterium]